MKLPLRWWLAMALVVSACGIEVGDVRVGPPPICDTTSRGMLILMAQAVPTAELIPCLQALPEGWVLERAEIETGSAELSLDGGHVGDVLVELVPECEPVGQEVADDVPAGATGYEQLTDRVKRRTVVYRGGCVVVESPNRLAAGEITREISFITRTRLRRLSGLDL